MSEGLHLALFAVISICSLASFAFSKSIAQNTEIKFVSTFRKAVKTRSSDADILAIIPAARNTNIMFKFGVIFLGWATSLFAVVGRCSSVFNKLNPENKSFAVQLCDISILCCVAVMLIVSVALLMNKNNTHLGY
jgi:hypothetical protein